MASQLRDSGWSPHKPESRSWEFLGALFLDRNNAGVGSLKTERVAPPSFLLGRLDAFLPQLALANEKLEAELQADPEAADKYNIENVDDGKAHVEMNLGLGLFEAQGIDMPGERSDEVEIRLRPEESLEAALDGGSVITSFFTDVNGNAPGVEEVEIDDSNSDVMSEDDVTDGGAEEEEEEGSSESDNEVSSEDLSDNDEGTGNGVDS
ncbi:hypothetical protein M427DRAFT_300401 [Gonapodya prolifera JEL478]|uniref:Uncharacterized protein n=1 Tax=Gonapodya prolifera (strain JEL478) TaxID=1344416 RepID=A0A139AI45_GONPJ|nr:hypothetical protein M427DRAFT_300401 [Gonapodya prolifera JEL478]|eukprot:KXS16083.1 hypothetical protein M427DRAFT_300401 [Gonapodya prolifera JEL478]